MKAFITTVASVLMAGACWATPVDYTNLQTTLQVTAATSGINWKVGDHNEYKLDMGFIQGTNKMSVTQDTAEGFWLTQDMDLGFAGKQKAEILIDKNTGAIKKLIVNGKEETPPKQDVEIISMEEAQITVPAGSFKCIHATIKDKSDGKLTNAWINPELVPINGMLKSISPSQMGDVTMELTSYGRGN